MGDVRRLVEALRAAGVTVHEWAGWDGRGNEDVAQISIKGAILHHTGTAYGSAFAGLVSSTRPDLYGGLLCNFAGNSDGSLTVTGSGLAWHAGGGYGPNQGPLAPYANNRNFYTVGLEIVYPGNSPMTDAQYQTALLFAKIVADLFAGGDLEYVRGHYEVNGRGYDGKWDPGYKPGTNIDMNAFRSQARSVVTNPIEEVKEPMFQIIQLEPTGPAEVREVVIALPWQGGAGGVKDVYVNLTAPAKPVKLGVMHFRGIYGLEPMVQDGVTIPAYGNTGGQLAPDGTYSVVVDYTAEFGASVVIEGV